ncbi:MAG: SDR family NAD(P)-dependent oxidoreductase [Tuberibacillus sp.]
MKKALVLGASGGMGYAIVKELAGRGVKVKAFARTGEKLRRLFGNDPNVQIAQGDLFSKEDLNKAAKDVDIIFHAANIPYPEWEKRLPTMMLNILETAKQHNLKLAIVDNIYAYGKNPGSKVDEMTPKRPHTKKGKIRLEVEKLVDASGVSALTCHFPDFYGPNAENTLLHYTLQSVIRGKKAGFVGNQRIPKEFIFTPDGAKAIVHLSLRDDAYGQHWNIPAADVITGEDILGIIRRITNYNKKFFTVSKNMIRFLGLLDAGMREVVEMYYLNENPVVLSGDKYEKNIGPLPRTAYETGLKQTIDYMKSTMV